jgi:phosphoribosylformylglycinamidine synthase
MIHFRGAPACSDFRIEKLLEAVRAVLPDIQALSAEYHYFVAVDGELSDSDRARLCSLLDARESNGKPSGALLLAIPRIGLRSPWASKATDIAHICGLHQVRNIERGRAWYLQAKRQPPGEDALRRAAAFLHDRMTETVVFDMREVARLFERASPTPFREIDILNGGVDALIEADQTFGLALSRDELDYLLTNFRRLKRNPSDVELMMFAQANSEHCRHKIFRGQWVIDGEPREATLFDMIRASYTASPAGILSAYRDNAAVIAGSRGGRFFSTLEDQVYTFHDEPIHLVAKVETHNHPTAVSPFPGAATGAGGEIRDEGATGVGAKPKAGLTGFSVSHLRIPDFVRPWEEDNGKPPQLAAALDIMLEGPIGAAAFNNEFGRPNLCGYFRTFERRFAERGEIRGYHKPIMLAGGLGNIRAGQVEKQAIPPGAQVIVLGGPAMLIGLGGGAASSMASGERAAELDFASVQRGNPEMQRRAQEVIDRCWAQGSANPILSIHDVGAGGLANAVPELLDAAGRGGYIDLRRIPSDEPGLSPLELWCNEAQERYVLAIERERLAEFSALCTRERCPFAVLGEATEDDRLLVADYEFFKRAVDMPLSLLLGKPPRMLRDVRHQPPFRESFEYSGLNLREAALRVLRLPAVADKGFLITIGDRTVGGLACRDQMVGPWQVPVADCAVTAAGFDGYSGEAMAVGERTPLALLDAPASGRMAVAEALTNIAAADIGEIANVRLSANWMAAAGHPGEDAALFDTVQAVGAELCPALGIAIPVGKDSLSMRAQWTEDGEQRTVVSPVSLIASAFAPMGDIRKSVTPELKLNQGPSKLLLIDLGHGRNRLGGSALAEVYGRLGETPPDVDDAILLKRFFTAVQTLLADGKLLAYHDRSDGGLFVTLCEMAFAGHCGLHVNLAGTDDDPAAAFFAEELGAVVQVREDDLTAVLAELKASGLGAHVSTIGAPMSGGELRFSWHGAVVLSAARRIFHEAWAETSFAMQRLRDRPEAAHQEYTSKLDDDDPGLHARVSFDIAEDISAPFVQRGARPRVAILREQGVNGQVEMAAAFDRAGFAAVDVHMSDILAGRARLATFTGLAACGGFSFGDVLGAGQGWAKSILLNARAYDEFSAFFSRQDSFGLGVCNGCQMLTALGEMVPGAAGWPRFVRNRSEQFEARLSLVEVTVSPSMFFNGMAGSLIPIVVSHGEGRAVFETEAGAQNLLNSNGMCLRYVDNYDRQADCYPANPGGSPSGITGVTTADGRFTALMPHPERCFRSVQLSWHPASWGEDSPWLRLFRNARKWVG